MVRIPTLSDLLADDVREYFLRESDCDRESHYGGKRPPQSREEEHPFRHPGLRSKLTQPYSYLSESSSDSDVESIDSGGVGRSSSTSSSLFQGVTKTMTSDTLTSAGEWSKSSSGENASSNHKYQPLDKPESFMCVEGVIRAHQMQQRKCSRQLECSDDRELLNDGSCPSYDGDEFSERSRSTTRDDSNYTGRSSDSSVTTSLSAEHQHQHEDNERYFRQTFNQQNPLHQNMDVSDELVRFHHSLELNQCHERNSLRGIHNGEGVGSNYSSMNASLSATETTGRQRNGHYKSMNHRLGGPGSIPLRLDDAIEVMQAKLNTILLQLELFISNMPSLVGSLALAWCSLGVDWFKVRYLDGSDYSFSFFIDVSHPTRPCK